LNSLKNKIVDLKEIVKSSLPEIMFIAETKLDSSFLDPQFFIDNYYKPTRKDFNSSSGGLMEYVKIGVLRKSLKDLELQTFKSICSELTINKE